MKYLFVLTDEDPLRAGTFEADSRQAALNIMHEKQTSWHLFEFHLRDCEDTDLYKIVAGNVSWRKEGAKRR